MKRATQQTRKLFLLALIWAVCPTVSAKAAEEKKGVKQVSYFRDIWPLIQRRCQGCHQPSVKQGDLDLTHFEGLRLGGRSGPTFVVGDADKSLILAFLSGKREPRMPLGQQPLEADQINLFEQWIKTGARDDTPTAVKPVAGTEPPSYSLPPVVTALAYSPDGSLLAVSGYREVLLHRSDGSGLEARLVGLSDRVQSLLFSADGKTLIAAGGTPAQFGELQVWDVASRKLRSSMTACSDTLFGAALSPDGSKISFGCSDNTVRVHELATGKELLKMGHHENWVLGTIFGRDGSRIVSVGRDGAAKLAAVSNGSFIENINLLHGDLAAIARHPLREAVVVGGSERIPYYYLMDRPRKMEIADESTLIRKFDRQNGEIFAIAFNKDGSKIAVAGTADEVPIYDVESGNRVAACKASPGIYAVAFHPDGAQIVASGFDGRVRIYATDSGDLVKDFIPVPISRALISSK
jgi:WD40 repeat protein